MTLRRLRRSSACGTAAALVLLFVPTARAQIGDGGAPRGDAAVTATADAAPDADAGVDVPLAPLEMVRPPAPPVSTTAVATAMLATPAPVETEPPRPITRRLWFWMAITGVVVGAVLIGVAVRNPNHTRPDCPPDYVCPP